MHNCILCGSPLTADSLLFPCENMPAGAQHIPSRKELMTDRGMTLQLHQCPGCGLVQFDCEPVSYYKEVIRAGGYSTTMRELRRAQYRQFIDRCGLEGKKLIEIGCGRGEFLQVLTEFPVRAFGIEENPALVREAQSAGLNVWRAFAGDEETKLDGAPYDAFLSFNFLEHQPDPNGMLRCISRNLTEHGVGLVTVPSLEYILANDGFYELMRDHIAYYSEETLRFLMNRNGFVVLECERVNRDTISVIVQKRPRVEGSGLLSNFNRLAAELRAFVGTRAGQGRKVAVWGASHQGFTVISTSGAAEHIRYIIDSAPFKQGRFAPASHVPIVSPDHFPEDPVDSILIIAPGYTDEIAGIIRSRFGPEVEIAVIRSASIEAYESME